MKDLEYRDKFARRAMAVLTSNAACLWSASLFTALVIASYGLRSTQSCFSFGHWSTFKCAFICGVTLLESTNNLQVSQRDHNVIFIGKKC